MNFTNIRFRGLQVTKRDWLVFCCVLLLAVLCISEAPSTLVAGELEENSWSVLPEDEKKEFLQCAAVEGKVYAFCFNRQAKAIDVHIYDPIANSWTIKTSPYELMDSGSEITLFASAVIGDRVYFFGYGMYENGMLNNRVYCTSTNTWSVISPSPNARFNPSSCTVDGKIYLIGGAVGEDLEPGLWGRQMTGIKWVETYDPTTGVWETKQPMEHAVQPFLFVMEDTIYALGGGYIQIYDTKKDQWKTIGTFQPEQTCKAAGATTGKYATQKIYLFADNTIFVFDPQTQTFEDSTSFPKHKIPEKYPNSTFGNHLDGFQVAVVDDVFYLINGGTIGLNQYGSVIDFKVDYRYVPLGYGATSPADGSGDGGSWLFFSLAGVVVAVAVLATAAVVVFCFRRVSR
jgi:hypothetical protein